MVIYARIAAVLNILASAVNVACQSVVIDASFYWRPLTIHAGLDDTWMQALSQFGGAVCFLKMKGLSSVRHRVRRRDKFLIQGENGMAEIGIFVAPCTEIRC